MAYKLGAQNTSKSDSLKEILHSSLEYSERCEILYLVAKYASLPDEKIEYSRELIGLASELNDIYYTSIANEYLGVGYRLKGNLNLSLESLFKSANGFSVLMDTAFLVEVYLEISTTYTQNNDLENALLFYSKAIEVLRQTDNDQNLAITLLNTGYVYYKEDFLDTALSYYNEAEPIFEKIGLEIGQAYTIGNRALVFWKQGDAQRAIGDLKIAIQRLEPLGDQYGMADYYNQLGNIYLELENHQAARKHIEKGLEMALAIDLKEQIRDAAKLLSELYRETGDYRQAYAYQSQYIAYKDSIQDQETTKRLADQRTEFEVGQKQAELDVVTAKQKTQRTLSIGLGVFLVLALAFAVVLYRNYSIKNKTNQLLQDQAVVLYRQKKELQQLNKTKDKFFSIVSHDLRGPITSFFGISPVIKSYVESKQTEQLLVVAEEIDKSVQQLSDLLDNLLNWATQQQSEIPYHPQELDVRHVADRVQQNLQNVAKAKNITLQVDVSGDIRAYGDRNTSETILRNLTSNALKFTPMGGQVTITAAMEGGQTLVSVTDTGVGMDQETIDTIFHLKETPSQYGTEGERGLGLGLQLVKEFTALNKGELKVESAIGLGSTFTFSLPSGEVS